MYKIGKFANLIGVTPQTLRLWDKSGKLHPDIIMHNHRYYSDNQLNSLKGIKQNEPNKIVVGYCRVSSQKQKDDLERQISVMEQYLTTQGKPFIIIQDIGSGINYTKKGLIELLKKITNNEIEKIVILYKDRLLRFGYELIEELCKIYNTKIEVINQSNNTSEEELVIDLVQIITVFSCKLNGKRKYKLDEFKKEIE